MSLSVHDTTPRHESDHRFLESRSAIDFSLLREHLPNLLKSSLTPPLDTLVLSKVKNQGLELFERLQVLLKVVAGELAEFTTVDSQVLHLLTIVVNLPKIAARPEEFVDLQSNMESIEFETEELG